MERMLFLMLFACALFFSSCAGDSATLKKPSENHSVNPEKEVKPIVNVYVDNTGSMFGYISQGNEFEWALSNLLTSLNLSDFTTADKIHLHYINSEIFPFKGDAPAFLKGVKIHTVKTYKGDLGKTCMSTFFTKVLERTNDTTISILISDFIISPGKGENATAVLASEMNSISNIVKTKLNSQPDLTMAMYRMESDFNGFFYDCTDAKKLIQQERPYYMWIMASRDNIVKFRSMIPQTSIDNGKGKSAITNSYVFFKTKSKKSPNFVVRTPSTGSVVPGGKGIVKAKLGEDRMFRFSVEVDLSDFILLGDYLTNPSSYRLSSKQYSVTKIEKRKGVGTTHRIYFKTTALPSPLLLSVSLRNMTPNWISGVSIPPSECDKVFSSENMNKTFGIKTISDAVFNAYHYNSNDLMKFDVSINNKKSN